MNAFSKDVESYGDFNKALEALAGRTIVKAVIAHNEEGDDGIGLQLDNGMVIHICTQDMNGACISSTVYPFTVRHSGLRGNAFLPMVHVFDMDRNEKFTIDVSNDKSWDALQVSKSNGIPFFSDIKAWVHTHHADKLKEHGLYLGV